MTGTTVAVPAAGRVRAIRAAVAVAVLMATLAVTLLLFGPTSGGTTPVPTHSPAAPTSQLVPSGFPAGMDGP